MTANSVFLDAGYAIALASPKDQYHDHAVLLARHIAANQVRLVITRAVCLEIGNALAKARYRLTAVAFLIALEQAPAVEIIPATDELCALALDLYRQRPDKEWGLTDCLSFVIMQQRGLTEALTSDEHFQQAGFKALLRD